MSGNRFGMTLTAGVIMTLAGLALGQSATPAQPPLKGPTVRDHSVPGEGGTLAPGGKKDKRERVGERGLPHQAFMKALNVLRGESAEAGVRLSGEQDSQIEAIDKEFAESVRAYKADHAEEVKGLMGSLTPEERKRVGAMLAGRPGAGKAPKGEKVPKGERAPQGGPDAAKPEGDAMMQPDAKASEDARAKLREIFENAPKPEDAHKKIFAVLTDAQRAAVEKELTRFRDEAQKRREEFGKDGQKAREQAERKIQKGKEAGAEGGPITSLDDPRIPPQMRERIKNLPPDQQRAAFRRALERLRQQQPEPK